LSVSSASSPSSVPSSSPREINVYIHVISVNATEDYVTVSTFIHSLGMPKFY
jgi:hypothetical protein